MEKRKQLLVRLLQDRNNAVRKAAADALEKIHVRERLDILEKKAEAGEMLDKIRTLYALAELKGERIFEIIGKALKDPSEDVRAAAVRALGSMDSRALTKLVDALGDESPIVVRCAVDAIARFNDPRTLGPLMKALKNSDSGVVEKAIEAVGRIGDKRCEDAMCYFAEKGNDNMRSLAIKAIGDMDF